MTLTLPTWDMLWGRNWQGLPKIVITAWSTYYPLLVLQVIWQHAHSLSKLWGLPLGDAFEG